jgi:hypothetical protein
MIVVPVADQDVFDVRRIELELSNVGQHGLGAVGGRGVNEDETVRRRSSEVLKADMLSNILNGSSRALATRYSCLPYAAQASWFESQAAGRPARPWPASDIPARTAMTPQEGVLHDDPHNVE